MEQFDLSCINYYSSAPKISREIPIQILHGWASLTVCVYSNGGSHHQRKQCEIVVICRWLLEMEFFELSHLRGHIVIEKEEDRENQCWH